MGATTLVSVTDYLSSAYDPDVDLVDGVLEDRSFGEKDHAKLQLKLAMMLNTLGGWFVAIETRIQVSPTRYRVPDVCVYAQEPSEQVFVTPPILVIEVLSPEDRMSRMQRKVNDYFLFGCHNIWILDPWECKAYQFDGKAISEVYSTLTTDDHRLSLSLAKIF